MDLEAFRIHCLSKKGTTEDLPFDETTLVFKVMGKMFALTALNRLPSQANLKCDPERAIELREEHEQVTPGYHMNKKHWNTVMLEEGLSDKLIIELIEHSYQMVVKGMTKKQREALLTL